MERRCMLLVASSMIAGATICAFVGTPGFGQRVHRHSLRRATHSANASPAECSQYQKIADCPLVGCGGEAAEQRLNERKNISHVDLSAAVPTNFDTLRKKKVPPGYKYGVTPTRQLLTDAGEGNVVTTVAWLTAIRDGSKETCNCKLSKPADTDNHMVLISDYVINHYSPAQWEKHSFTVEFAPRVKAKGHPNFKVGAIRPLIVADPRLRLRVRITGPLMLDDYHVKHPLPNGRQTNWEIHPVFKFEYCPHPQQCSLASDGGWVNIDD